jgi:hypothetical protein
MIKAAVALALATTIAGPGSAEPVFQDAPFDDAHWTFSGPDVRQVDALQQKALRLQDGVARLKVQDFATGIITYDVLFASDAPMYTGLRFHGRDEGQYEYFYLRAERTGMADATQYTPVFHGDQGWQIYAGPAFASEEGFKRGGWNHVEVRIYPDSADVFINGVRSLRIPDLKTGHPGGYLAFSSSFGPRFPFNQVYYAHVRYSLTPLERPADMPAPTRYASAGLIRRWQVSPPMPQAEARALAARPGPSQPRWTDLPVETNGVANLARLAAPSPAGNTVVARFDVVAEKPGPRLMRFGYSDAVDVFVNGQLTFQGDARFLSRDLQFQGTVGFNDAVAATLKRGRNEIALVVKEAYGGWAAAAEFADPAGLTGPSLGGE